MSCLDAKTLVDISAIAILGSIVLVAGVCIGLLLLGKE